MTPGHYFFFTPPYLWACIIWIFIALQHCAGNLMPVKHDTKVKLPMTWMQTKPIWGKSRSLIVLGIPLTINFLNFSNVRRPNDAVNIQIYGKRNRVLAYRRHCEFTGYVLYVILCKAIINLHLNRYFKNIYRWGRIRAIWRTVETYPLGHDIFWKKNPNYKGLTLVRNVNILQCRWKQNSHWIYA